MAQHLKESLLQNMEHDQLRQEDGKELNDMSNYDYIHEPDDNDSNIHDVMSQNEGEGEGKPIRATPDPPRRYQRKWKPTSRILKSIQQQEIQEVIKCDEEYETILDNFNCIALMLELFKDIVYFVEAIKQPDAKKFIYLAVDKLTTHLKYVGW